MFINKLKTIISNQKSYKILVNNILSGESASVSGLTNGLKTLLVTALSDVVQGPIFILLPDYEEAEAFSELLLTSMGDTAAAFFPGGDEDPESPVILNPHRVGMQMQALKGLITDEVRCIVIPPSGLCMRLPHPEKLRSSIVRLSPGMRLDLAHLTDDLIESGYVRESLVERPGEISIRGGILDIYLYSGTGPYRVEFFGDEIDTLRIFDVNTQTSIGRTEKLELVTSPVAWKERNYSIVDYLGKGGLVFCEDPDLIAAEIKKLHRGEKQPYDESGLNGLLENKSVLSHHTLSIPDGTIDFGGRPLPRLGHAIPEIRETIASLCHLHEHVVLLCDDKKRIGRVRDFLELEEAPIADLRLEQASIGSGFSFPPTDLLVISEWDLFGRTRKRRRRGLDRRGVPIRELSSLNKGDFVVHVDYGIGEYLGLQKIEVQNTERECLAIRYSDEDKVYVPVDQMIRVQKYMSAGGKTPSLNKLGSGKWERIKEKTKRSIQDIART